MLPYSGMSPTVAAWMIEGFLNIAMSTERNAWAWWRCIPNGISLARIGGALVLLTAALGHNQRYFQWLLVACILSDIIDGWIARTFDWTSRLGAILDSTGDILVQLVAIGGLWIFYRRRSSRTGCQC